MFQQTPTSKIIAFKFTLYVTATLILFSVVANGLFFRERYMGETKRLMAKPITIQNIPFPNGRIVGSVDIIPSSSMASTLYTARPDLPFDRPEKFMRTIVESFPYSDKLHTFLKKNTIIKNISMIDDEYVLYAHVGNTMQIVVITRQIEAQKNILIISLLGVLFFGILTYGFSHYFVTSSLSRLEKLRQAVSDLDIDNLHTQLPLEGPANDEVRIIGEKLQESLHRVHTQTTTPKDFVGNVSHELKTPLMQIGGHVDYMIKAKTEYDIGLQKIKQTTKSMNTIIDSMLLLMKLDTIESKNMLETDISSITHSVIDRVKAIYNEKNIQLETHISGHIQKNILPQHYDILIQNLITNAYKYTTSGTISIYLDEKKLQIKDTGVGIHKDEIGQIREKFRQADKSKADTASYGLGLAIVKKIIDVYGWSIHVESETSDVDSSHTDSPTRASGTIFTIIMNS